jgi:O-antigen/teichoic acid export membrane protein
MKVKSSLGGQAFWLLVAKLIGFACNLALPILLARALAPREYGLFKQAFLSMTTLSGLLPLGMSISAFYYLARRTEKRGAVVLNVLLWHAAIGAVAGMALAMFPGLWRNAFPGSPELAERSGFLGLLLFATLFSGILESLATANQQVGWSTLFIAGSQGSKAALLSAAAVWNPALDTLLSAGLLHASLEGLVLLWYAGRAFPGYWREFDGLFFREQLRYAAPLGAAGLVFVAQTDLANYFVSWRYGPAAYAVFANGNFQIPLIGLLRDALSSLLISRMSGLEAEKRGGEIAELAGKVTKRLLTLYLPATVFFYYFAGDLIRLVYGRQYEDSITVFRVTLLGFPLQAFVLDPVLRAYAEHRYYLLRLRLVTIGVLAAALWLSQRSGGAPLAAAMGAVVIVNSLERLLLIAKVRTILKQAGDFGAEAKELAHIGLLALAPLAALELSAGWWSGWPGWARIMAGASLYGGIYVGLALATGLLRRADLGELAAAARGR